MNELLNKKIENRLIVLGNKKYRKTLLLTLAWVYLVLVFFVVFIIRSERSFAEIRNYIVLLLWIVPFFPFSAHKVLFSKTFYATVAYKVNSIQFDSLKRASGMQKPDKVAVLEITYKKDDGKKFTVTYKKDVYLMDGLHYSEGDRVFFVRGLKYPFKFPVNNEKDYTCPACGRTIEAGETTCKRCELNLKEYKL